MLNKMGPLFWWNVSPWQQKRPVKTHFILSLVAHTSKTNSVTTPFLIAGKWSEGRVESLKKVLAITIKWKSVQIGARVWLCKSKCNRIDYKASYIIWYRSLSFWFFWFFRVRPLGCSTRNLWNKLSQVVVRGCVETLVPYSGLSQHGRTFKVISYCQSNFSKALLKWTWQTILWSPRLSWRRYLTDMKVFADEWNNSYHRPRRLNLPSMQTKLKTK